MTLAAIENIKPATVTKTVTETGHHSFVGRSEFIQKLIDDGGEPKTKEDWQIIVKAVKARFPQNASPVNVVKAGKAYIARKAKAAAKAAATETETKSESKPRSVKPKGGKSKSKRSKSKSKSDEKSAEKELSVAA